MEFSCKCHNSGVNSFTGRCSNCGMTKPSQGTFTSSDSGRYKTIHENEVFVNPPKITKRGGGTYTEKDNRFKFEEDLFLLELNPAKKRIKQLISSTPNDFELGRLIREMYSER